MLQGKLVSGWRGMSLIAIAYIHFLIFAQFAFLKRLDELNGTDVHMQAVMAAMAIGGILASLLAPRVRIYSSPQARLALAFLACAASSFLTPLVVGFISALAESFFIGASVGLLTVTLATHLRLWTGNHHPLFMAGAGTGLGYFVCNIPALFSASPMTQAFVAGGLSLCGAAIATLSIPEHVQSPSSDLRARPTLLHALPAFTALVWLDSAAFFIIQNTPALKALTWQGPAHLWTNGLLHLAAALLGAIVLRSKGLFPVLASSFFALAAACLLLHGHGTAQLASILYPIGVSLYSVALVAYPSLLAAAGTTAERGRIAGWIYAVAGWIGSAMGIGMAQHLGQVPYLFLLAAGLLILSPHLIPLLRSRTRELALTALVAIGALVVTRLLPASNPSSRPSSEERGRQVYISEGCIHCHSQYVRPKSADVLLWGPAESLDRIRLQSPPLIGNRRQGPDLSQVGARRSPIWLKAHLLDPAEVSGKSIMPSYRFLFNGNRGDDLVAYLASLRSDDLARQIAIENQWRPNSAAVAQANLADGNHLYQRNCATCHDANGRTRRAWQTQFKRTPTEFGKEVCVDLAPSETGNQRIMHIARVAKFGIYGTDMPGHEYLSDRDLVSISLWLSQAIAHSTTKSESTHPQ